MPQQTDGELKERKALILIGIVCDEEIKDTVNDLPAKGKEKMVRTRFFSL